MFSVETLYCGWFSETEFMTKKGFYCIDDNYKKILVTHLNTSPYDNPYKKETEAYKTAIFVGYVKLYK